MKIGHRFPRIEGRQKLSIYSVYGLTFGSDFTFTNPLKSGSAVCDFTLTRVAAGPLGPSWPHSKPVYTSPYRADDGNCLLYLYREDGVDLLRFPRTADFYLYQELILCHRTDPTRHEAVELHFLGDVLTFWLERQGIAVLHSAGVVLAKSAVAFIADSGCGKSTLAAALMRAGLSLLADDIVAIEHRNGYFYAQPAYPQIRLWPAEAGYFLDSCKGLPKVRSSSDKRRVTVGLGGIGSFCDAAMPLGCIYLLKRLDSRVGGHIEIMPVSPREGFIEMVRNSFSPRLVEAAGFQSRRLSLFAELAKTVPIRRLTYSGSLEHLSRVQDAILQNLSSLGGDPVSL